MLKRFIRYYKPHLLLFSIDMFVASLAAVLELFFPTLTRDLLKIHIPEKNFNIIIQIFIFMIVIYIFKAIFEYIRIKWGHYLGVRMEYDMRSDIFRHLQKLSFNYFDETKTGHIMSRISNDLNMIAEVAHHAPEDLIISVFTILGAFIMMFLFNYKLAIISLIPLPIMLIWGIFFGGRMRNGFRGVRTKIANINSSVENSVQGIREVKSYTNEELEISKFDIVNTTFKIAKEKMYNIMAIFHSGIHFINDLYYFSVIAGGVWLIYTGDILVADLIAFILYINLILKPIQRLINFTEQSQQGAAAFERFIEIMNIEPDIVDKKNALALDNIKGNIEIENLTFKYNSSKQWILKNIDIEIKAGQKIALVGESGAGKSTLASLIPRFYEIQEGKINIDGYDIMNLQKKFLRENIGIVQQDLFLFDGTIRENIIYGKPDSSEEEIIEAAKKANIYNFISSLPDNLDTYVGERGVKLSGGQKQRISIARVFLKNPAILIFDEATSSLDAESESLIQESMFELSQNRTTIIIAHRLATVKHVDKIYVLKNGEVVEKGTHQELISNKGYYYSLYEKNLI